MAGKYFHLNTYKVGAIVLVTLVVFCVFSPFVFYKAGNVFFGEKPALYNVRLAQYFFLGASYPVIGEAPEFAHYQLSRTYFIQGKLDVALDEALKEFEIHPQNKRTHYILGLTYGYLNREEEAVEEFGKFIEAFPNTWAARNDRAWLQFRIGDLDGALMTLDPVKDLQNPWVQNTYGTLLLNKGDLANAKKALKHAERLVLDMTEREWGSAYPGNDPLIYKTGLGAMRTSISENLNLIADKEALLSPNEPE